MTQGMRQSETERKRSKCSQLLCVSLHQTPLHWVLRSSCYCCAPMMTTRRKPRRVKHREWGSLVTSHYFAPGGITSYFYLASSYCFIRDLRLRETGNKKTGRNRGVNVYMCIRQHVSPYRTRSLQFELLNVAGGRYIHTSSLDFARNQLKPRPTMPVLFRPSISKVKETAGAPAISAIGGH